ncbi:MAG: hypothetical protein CMJ83_14365 [Planctomycetes bacterium]|nr:hypothetical protein [Planctomycetota bacterium]
MRVLLVVSLVAVVLVPLPAQKKAAEKARPLTDDEKVLHVLSRLSFGPVPGQFEKVRQLGIDKWIDAQLAPEKLDAQSGAARRKQYRTLGLTPFAQTDLYDKMKGETGQNKMANRNAFNQQVRRELQEYIVDAALYSEAQLFEVLADFWRNHFSVDVAKDSVRYTATHYETDVIRKNIYGKFKRMLSASSTHPAMLVFLDNHISRAPPSKAELKQIERTFRRRGSSREQAREQAEIQKQRGLNENYARELMELHTLGVDNGYSQQDVEMVARAFTGWSVDFGKEGTGFSYKDAMHDRTRKAVMGRSLPRGRRETGMNEGKAVIDRLCKHKNTAQFIATKLTRYFVNDEPPTKIIDAAANKFRTTKGDLREVVKTIVKHPEFYDRAHYKAKFKTPLEFVVSALRATSTKVDKPNIIVAKVGELGMPLYGCEDPTGWEDTAEAWRDPGVMALRWQFALQLVRGRVRGMRIPDSFYKGLPADPLDLMDALIKRVVPHGLGSNTYAVLERVVFKLVQDGGGQGGHGKGKLQKTIVGILLGSPEFQQQ